MLGFLLLGMDEEVAPAAGGDATLVLATMDLLLGMGGASGGVVASMDLGGNLVPQGTVAGLKLGGITLSGSLTLGGLLSMVLDVVLRRFKVAGLKIHDRYRRHDGS